MLDLLILGTAGHAREIAWLVEDILRAEPAYRLAGFVAGTAAEKGLAVGDYQVVATDEELARESRPLALALGVATPAIVTRLLARLAPVAGFEFPNLLHPGVALRKGSVSFGRGNLVCAGNILTTDISVGDFNLFNRGCQVGHDCVLGDRNVLNPGAILSGGVRVGNGCLIGSGAVILQNLEIGDGAVIGAGAVVTRSVAPGLTVAGVPARPLQRSR